MIVAVIDINDELISDELRQTLDVETPDVIPPEDTPEDAPETTPLPEPTVGE